MEPREAPCTESQDSHCAWTAWSLSTVMLCLRPLEPARKCWLVTLQELGAAVYVRLVVGYEPRRGYLQHGIGSGPPSPTVLQWSVRAGLNTRNRRERGSCRDATQPGRAGANIQFYIICHRLLTLLKARAPSQPTCCPGGSGCHSACTLAGFSAKRNMRHTPEDGGEG